MDSNTFRPQVESLEEKNAPSPLVITLPAQAAGTPAVTADLPDAGCAGVTTANSHTTVVSC